MTETDYRAMASEIRDLIPLLLHSQSVADLRVLADRYERLADYLHVHPAHCRKRVSSIGARRTDIR
jgi:predicted Zn-ribbon and HTH transcriptional regulator